MNVDVSELHTNQQKIETCNEDYWAKLRVKSDSDGAQYYDVLCGEKHKKPHMHIGWSLLGQMIFCEDRDVITTMTKETESQLHGKYPKEKLVLKEGPGKCNIIVRVKAIGSSKESFIEVFELESIP